MAPLKCRTTSWLVFSAHDYAAHGWGHESLEAWDILLRLDTTLAEFKKYLGAKVGEGQGSLVVTSDHSAAPLLERRIAAGLAGQRDASQRIVDAAQAAASVGLGWAKARGWRTRGIQRSLFRARCWLNQRKNERLRYRRCALLVHSCLASRLRHSPPRLRAFVKPVWMQRWRFVWRSIRCGWAKLYFCRQKDMVLHENDEAVATHPGSRWSYDCLVPVIVVARQRAPVVAVARRRSPVVAVTRRQTRRRCRGLAILPPLVIVAKL